jgi:putative toxin-antitoxin system antitoxin component (TIGR02293 family)
MTRSAAKTGLSLPLSTRTTSQRELIQHIKNGLAFSTLESLAFLTGQPVPDLAPRVGIPLRTLARRKSSGRLSMEESERVVRLSGLYEKASELFNGDMAGVRQWMSQPKKALGGESPLDYAATELGAREVENLIGRLEHGVFA